VLVVLVACVGDDPVTTPGSSGSSGSSDDAGTSGDSGSSGDSGTLPGGFRADRVITCNNGPECKGAQLCCGTGTDWLGVSCKDNCAGAYQLQCNDRADCAGAGVCCMVTDGGARATNSYCAEKCEGTNVQQLCLLGGSGECPAATSCQPLTMFSPNGLAKCK
jgi:hypothetical protein